MGIMMNGGLLGLVVILSDYSMFSIDFPIFPWVFHHENCQKRRFYLVDFGAPHSVRSQWPPRRSWHPLRGVEWPSMEHGVSAIISWCWMIDVVADLKGMSPNFCCIT